MNLQTSAGGASAGTAAVPVSSVPGIIGLNLDLDSHKNDVFSQKSHK